MSAAPQLRPLAPAERVRELEGVIADAITDLRATPAADTGRALERLTSALAESMKASCYALTDRGAQHVDQVRP
jgi:hypothetical protein